MRIVIAGAGKVGYHLTTLLNKEKHIVSTIERNKALCERLALDVESLVICGDATSLKVLEDAELNQADVLIVTTGKDEENLAICQLAKVKFNIPKIIARINNPKNERIFRALGIEYTVSSTQIIANLIEEEAIISGMRTLITLEQGEVSLVEYTVKEGSSQIVNKKIKELILPEECNIAYILRNRKVVIPRGEISIEAYDKIIILVSHKQKKALEKLFVEKYNWLTKKGCK